MEDKKTPVKWGSGLSIKKFLRAPHTSTVTERINKARAGDTVASATKANRIALVTDNSGSMAGKAIGQLKEACASFIDNCDFADTSVSVHTFGRGDDNEINLPLTDSSTILKTTISRFSACSDTPMRWVLEDVVRSISTTRVVLVSDGHPSDFSIDDCKPTPPSWLTPYIEMGIPIDCVHITDGGGEDVMKYLAEKTGGVFVAFRNIDTFVKKFKYLTPRYRALLAGPNVAGLLEADDFEGKK
jgi:Mg-chelatase subunit ChlD